MIRSHRELDVWKNAFSLSMDVFRLSQSFPQDERYSLTDQIRRSSRSVAACLSEAWSKRCYEAAFVAKLSDAEAEALETQTWIDFAAECGYLTVAQKRDLLVRAEIIVGQLIRMINDAPK